MKVFHYSKVDHWRDIAWTTETKTETGLRPGCRLGIEYVPAQKRSAIFALLNRRPKEWTENADFCGGPWEVLRQSIGKLLLEIEVDPSRVSVVDWAHREGFLRGANAHAHFCVPKQFSHRTRMDAEKAYVESALPLEQYLRENRAYSLPEVIIEHPVPLDQLRVSEDQSLLEEHLRTMPPDWTNGELWKMEFIPGLESLIAKIRRGLRKKVVIA